MRFEILEIGDAWIVRHNGVEVARHADERAALNDIGERLRARSQADGLASLALRYRLRAA